MRDVTIFDFPCVLLSKVIVRVDYGHLVCHFSLMKHNFTFDPILPSIYTLAFHLVVDPLGLTSVSIGPPHGTWPVQLIAFKVADTFIPAVGIISRIGEFPFAVELVIEKITFVAFSVCAL